MCLHKLYKKITVTEGFGEKIFCEQWDGLHANVFPNISKPYPVDEWINEFDYRAAFPSMENARELIKSYDTGIVYPKGFHVRLRQRKGKGRSVEFRKVVAQGWEYSGTVVVAKEMRILPENEIVIEYC